MSFPLGTWLFSSKKSRVKVKVISGKRAFWVSYIMIEEEEEEEDDENFRRTPPPRSKR
jgi:hypothetical protein